MAEVIDPETAVLHIPKMIRQDDYGYRTSVEGKEVTPLTIIPFGNEFKIAKNAGKTTFTLRRLRDGYYVCSCPSWKFSTERDKMRKTCPHLTDILGEDYERERIGIAKEAKSTVWESNKFRRTVSDSLHARHNQAKSMLDAHYKHLSSSQPSAAPSSSTSGPVDPQSSNCQHVPTMSAAAPASRESTSLQVPAGPKRSTITADASTSTSHVVADSTRPLQPPQRDAGSDTETEDEESLPSGSRTIPKSGPTTPSRSSTRRVRADGGPNCDSDDDDFVDDLEISPTKRARYGRGRRRHDDDDKVSLLLAKNWQLDADPSKPRSKPMDPTGWWVSEKLDGVRAFWDGKRLYSRQKIEWNAPAWWKNRLPKDITLDGELWMSRGTFQQTSQICRSTVRMGRLRTFKHHEERDSLERQWLREQVGGKLASQERLRQERERARQEQLDLEAGRLSATSAVGTVAGDPVEGGRAGEKTRPSWKSVKRMRVCITRPSSNTSGTETVRLSLGQALFEVVMRRAVSSDLPAEVLPSVPTQADSILAYSEKSVRRCRICGKMLADPKQSRCPPRPLSRDGGVATHEIRDLLDQVADQEPLPPSAPCPLPSSLRPAIPPSTSPDPRNRRMAHPYSNLASAQPDRSMHTSGIGRHATKSSSEWNQIKFMIFDSPSLGSQPVEDRWAELEKRFGATDGADIDDLEGPQIVLVSHQRCKSRDHLTDLMKQVEAKGGEGLMLRQPKSQYEGRRGNTLYKLKSWYDAEAVVIGYADGAGRHEGRTGSLVAKMACGTVFRVGTGMSDSMRENPPPLGSIISYRFFELSEDGYPRFPAFRGVAVDKSVPKDAVVRPSASMLRSTSNADLLP
ncbi:hypothetical protein BCV70DRAFT_199750 [Testicularia cyperi]|uniref:ATP-dependent DNA ligase family profile domain-containing protein n=1 Tax=Testicularia cyperi TaxID=1882483 RepID=A0A317XQT9_9BASI|nr:hypothetical protein BCV70DRAFT_199750 [Testicularia cyperi]